MIEPKTQAKTAQCTPTQTKSNKTLNKEGKAVCRGYDHISSFTCFLKSSPLSLLISLGSGLNNLAPMK